MFFPDKILMGLSPPSFNGLPHAAIAATAAHNFSFIGLLVNACLQFREVSYASSFGGRFISAAIASATGMSSWHTL